MMYNLPTFQIIAIIGSIVILIALFELVRKRKLKESYSLLWFGIGLLFLVFSLWRGLLEYIAALLGVAYPPAALFLILLIGLYLLSLHFSLVISRLSENNKNLSQEIGLMKSEIKKLKEGRKRAK